MGARDTLERAAARTGWNTDSMLDVICAYVDNQGCDDAVADFVEAAADEERGAANGTPGLFDDPGGAVPDAARAWDVWPAIRCEVFGGGGRCDTYWDPTHDAGEAEGWVVVEPDGAVHVASEHEAFATAEDALARATRLARRGGGRARAWGSFVPDAEA